MLILILVIKALSLLGFCLFALGMMFLVIGLIIENEYLKSAILCLALILPGAIYSICTGDSLVYECQTNGKKDLCLTKPATETPEAK